MQQPEEWSKYAERIVASGERPHFAPEPETIAVHARQLERARAAKGAPLDVVVLGATPELADLALLHGCRVRRIDCNPAMFQAARKRQAVRDREAETLIVADWLHMTMIGDGAVDMVLGDSALNNVPHALMPQLLDELARITHPGSTLSLRQIVLPDDAVDDYRFDRTVARYRAGAISANEFHKILRFYSFVDEAYDPALHLLDARKVFQAIRQRHAQGELNDDEHAFLNTRYSEIQHTVYRQSDQRALLERLGPCSIERAGPACYYENLFNVFVVRRH